MARVPRAAEASVRIRTGACELRGASRGGSLSSNSDGFAAQSLKLKEVASDWVCWAARPTDFASCSSRLPRLVSVPTCQRCAGAG
jgi:hypothetical protein